MITFTPEPTVSPESWATPSWSQMAAPVPAEISAASEQYISERALLLELSQRKGYEVSLDELIRLSRDKDRMLFSSISFSSNI